jgi:hypothetical protein
MAEPLYAHEDESGSDELEIIEYEDGRPGEIRRLPKRTHGLMSAPRLLEIHSNTNIDVPGPLIALQDEEKALGYWPRRLLHVPTMTSYEWTTGACYGGIPNPLYNAISYTWGRWKLAEDTSVNSAALVVRNIEWKIPRIDPSCFSVMDFESAIKTACATHEDPNGLTSFPAVDFLWLDVACIDQRPSNPRSMAEVGRQASIFKGAQTVLVWMHSLDHDTLRICCENTSAPAAKEDDNEFASLCRSTLRLLKDPWFSSLWTLQEAFLRLDALLISKDASVVTITRDWKDDRGEHQRGSATIDLVEVFEETTAIVKSATFRRVLGAHDSATAACELWRVRVSEELERAGVLTLTLLNPLVTYLAAQKRNVSRVVDQIYAIQQIFNFRLGSTAVHRDTAIDPKEGTDYTVDELQDQLGEQLLLHHAVLSQCHVYTKCTPFGKAWRVNDSSIVVSEWHEALAQRDGDRYPDPPTVWLNGSEVCENYCRFDVYPYDGSIWGQFEGRICPFEVFHRANMEYEADCIMTQPYAEDKAHSFFNIWLDECETVEQLNLPFLREDGLHFIACREQRRVAKELAIQLSPSLHVLILGRELSYGRSGGEMLGMLLYWFPDGPLKYWRRIGICKWMLSHMTFAGVHHKMKPWFEGESEDWSITKGIFG